MPMNARASYPRAVDPAKVGSYPALAKAGGGYVWDEVLEYRVWCHPGRGAADLADGHDYFRAFAEFAEALAFHRVTRGAERPLALVLQKEYIDEPTPGQYVHIKRRRITEWPMEFLHFPRREESTIPRFLASDTPADRMDVIRGVARSAPARPAAGKARRAPPRKRR